MTVCWKKKLTLYFIHHWQQKQSCNKMHLNIFRWHKFFSNSINIIFGFYIDQFLILSTFSFIFLQTLLLINLTSIFSALNSWIISVSLESSMSASILFLNLFLIFFWMLSMLVTMNKLKHAMSFHVIDHKCCKYQLGKRKK